MMDSVVCSIGLLLTVICAVSAQTCTPNAIEPSELYVIAGGEFSLTATFPEDCQADDVRFKAHPSDSPKLYTTLIENIPKRGNSTIRKMGLRRLVLTLTNASVTDSHSYVAGTDDVINNNNIVESLPMARVIVIETPKEVTIMDSSATSAHTSVIMVEEKKGQDIVCETMNTYPAPVLKWYENGLELASEPQSDTRPSTADGDPTRNKLYHSAKAYRLSSPMKSDYNRTLECRVQHYFYGNSTLVSNLVTTVRLVVLYAPEISLSSDQTQFTEGDTISYTCKEDSPPEAPAASWRWMLNGKHIEEVTGPSIIIPDVSGLEYDGKTLTCSASNSVGTRNLSFSLEIIYGPVLVSASDHLYLNRSQKGNLTCVIRGNPTPMVVWTYDSDDNVEYEGDEGGVGFNSDVFTFTGQKFGIYTCAGRSRDRKVSHDFYVIERGLPTFAKNMQTTFEFNQGDSGQTITCEGEASPRPTITWFKDGRRVSEGTHHVETINQDTVKGRTGRLIFTEVSVGDFGSYVCVLTNMYGTAESYFTVVEKENTVWQYIAIAVGCLVALVLIAVLTYCLCKRRSRKGKGSSAGSISAGSNSTDNSTQKQPDLPSVDESVPPSSPTALPPYSIHNPVDSWDHGRHDTAQRGNTHMSYEGLDYPNSLQGSQYDQSDGMGSYSQRQGMYASSPGNGVPPSLPLNHYPTYNRRAPVPPSNFQDRVAPPENFATLPRSSIDHVQHHYPSSSYKPALTNSKTHQLATNV